MHPWPTVLYIEAPIHKLNRRSMMNRLFDRLILDAIFSAGIPVPSLIINYANRRKCLPGLIVPIIFMNMIYESQYLQVLLSIERVSKTVNNEAKNAVAFAK